MWGFLLSNETRPTHPYSALPDRQYWRRASAPWASHGFSGVYVPRFAIEKTTSISTAGSCFAQHVSRNLRNRGYKFLDFQPAPPLLPAELHGEFGYGQYSARYGNIYTTLQLGQLLRAAFGSCASTRFGRVEGASSIPCDRASSPTDSGPPPRSFAYARLTTRLFDG